MPDGVAGDASAIAAFVADDEAVFFWAVLLAGHA